MTREAISAVVERYFLGYRASFVEDRGKTFLRMANDRWVAYLEEEWVNAIGMLATLIDFSDALVHKQWNDDPALFGIRERERRRIKRQWVMEPA